MRLPKGEFPKETSESSDFAVVADDDGAVWISFVSGNSVKADLYHVLGGKAERRLPQVTKGFPYRAPDKTFWFSGEHCLWHLVGDDFVRVNLPPEMVNQYQFLQTITEDQQGGIWVSFGRHGLYRLANGSWTPYGGRTDFPKIRMYTLLRSPIAWAACGSVMRRASWRFWMATGSVDSVRAMIFKWATSPRSMDEDERFGSGVNLGWSSLTRDASTRSPLWMTDGCAESLESWKHPREIDGSTRFQGFSISVRPRSPKL
jgi:hypothetical protein